MTYLLYNWNLYLLLSFIYFAHTSLPTAPLATTNLSSVVMILFVLLFCFFYIPHVSEIRWYLFVFLRFISPHIRPSRSLSVVTNGKISFFLIAELYFLVYILHIVFIHSSLHGHLGCFPILVITNNVSINIGMHTTFQISVFIFFG